jgi:uncharacterized protein HemX
MRRATPDSLHDRQASLEQLRSEAEAEAEQLERDERTLLQQVRQAQEQVRYYEGLLVQLRRDWGAAPPLARLIRRLG